MKQQILPKDIRQLVDCLNEDELHSLYRAVGDRLRLFHRTKALFAMRDFQILDKVYFIHHGERKEGTVTRLNQRTISVVFKDGAHWNVSPELLRKIEENKPLDELPLATQEKVEIGRNSPCWCGSGKKYKRCHFLN